MSRIVRVATTSLAVAIGLVALVVSALLPQGPPDHLPPFLTAVWGATWIGLGWVVLTRRPEHVMPRIMMGLGALMAMTSLWDVMQSHSEAAQVSAELVSLVQRVGVSLYVLIGLGIGLIVHLFPTGATPAPGWRWPVRMLVTAAVLLTTGFVLGIDPAQAGPLLKATAAVSSMGYALGLLSAIPSLAYRMWRSRGTERAQVKWFLLAVVVATIGWWADALPDWLQMLLVIAPPPLAITLAMLRYRLYDIDRVISRTVSYAVVTGLLLATYTVVVTSVTRLLPDSSTLAVAVATLAAAALARPLLRRVQGSVDRRFNRARYDAQQTVEQFGGRLRLQIHDRQVALELTDAVSLALQPSEVSLWVRRTP